MLFGTMVDMFLFQNPVVADRSALAVFFPGYAPVRAAMDAGFTDSVDLATFGIGLTAAVVLGVLAIGAFYRSTRPS